MQELIKVQVEGDQQLVSARDLHKGLEIKKRFSAWVEQNFKDFEEDIDFTSVPTSTVVGNGAVKPLVDYALTIDMAKQLCLLSRTEKGKQYRKYLIEVEKKLRVILTVALMLHTQQWLQVKGRNTSLTSCWVVSSWS